MTHHGAACISTLFLVLVAGTALEAGELTVTRVFGPEIPTGPYKHPACLTELENGDLYLVYYGGSGEYAIETAVFGSRLKKGETRGRLPNRSPATPCARSATASSGRHPDGVVWLFYVVRYGATWSTSRIQCKLSHDNAATWSDASVLSLDEGDMVRGRPIVLNNGDYLLPIYHETGHDPELGRPRQHVAFSALRSRQKDLDQDRTDSLAQGKHSAGGRAAQRPRSGRLLPARGRLRPQDDRLYRPLGIARRRHDLERGQGLGVPQSQRRRSTSSSSRAAGSC